MVLTIVLVFVVRLPFFESLSDTDAIGPQKITELNKTYEGDLKITATDIKVIKNPDNEDMLIVGVKFFIENNSRKTYRPYNKISCYVDNMAATEASSKYFDSVIGSNLGYGKKTTGYISVLVEENAKEFEIQFLDHQYDNCVNFVFDIPAVE